VNLLIVGAGGVGSAIATIVASRGFVDRLTVADIDQVRAQTAVDRLGGDRAQSMGVDASDRGQLAALIESTGADFVLNACDPRFNPPIFETCLATGRNYLDMALTLSRPHPDRPHEQPGIKLGDEQFDVSSDWEAKGLLALVGMGADPGLSDVFARYAADHLFTTIDEVAVRDGADLVIEGYAFAPTFSIWTTIEECLNPPLIWERERGFYTTPPFSEPEVFEFPQGIGPIECVNVEHEEVVLVPRHIDCNRVTFKFGLGSEFIEVLSVLHKVGLDGTEPVAVKGVAVAPRDVVAAALPDPARLGDRMSGRTCVGTYVTGTGLEGKPRFTYLYHCLDNAESMGRWGHQAVVFQTALNPVVALELIAEGTWTGAGVLGPEAMDAVPFLDRLNDYGFPWAIEERTVTG